MKAREYLSAVRTRLQERSSKPVTDYQIAKALKIQTSLASRYLKGQSIPGPVVAFRVAELIGDQPAAVIADFEAERAERDGKPEEAEELQAHKSSLLKRVSGAFAASILLMAGSAGFSNAEAHLARQSGIDLATHRVKRRRQGPPAGGAAPSRPGSGTVSCAAWLSHRRHSCSFKQRRRAAPPVRPDSPPVVAFAATTAGQACSINENDGAKKMLKKPRIGGAYQLGLFVRDIGFRQACRAIDVHPTTMRRWLREDTPVPQAAIQALYWLTQWGYQDATAGTHWEYHYVLGQLRDTRAALLRATAYRAPESARQAANDDLYVDWVFGAEERG